MTTARAISLPLARSFVLLMLAVLMPAMWGVSSLSAEEVVVPEYQVKAAFLYNFAKFTEWPTNAFAATNSPFVIAVLGRDPFGKNLDEIVKDKQLAGRAVVVRRYRRLEDVGDCHVLFTLEGDAERQKEIFHFLERRPVLTVGEGEGFAARGGVVRFFKEDKRVRFEINVAPAKAAGLQMSSRLLRLAVIVKPETR